MPTDFEIELRLLLEAVYLKYHYDFRRYAASSLKRRIGQATADLGYSSVSRLQEHVLREPKVFQRLLSYLTVQVSDMFRDPPFYRALRQRVVPLLQTYPSLKIWVAGTSTGEEVYSIAIVLEEEGLLERTLLYATDINTDALDKAKAGIYEIGRMVQFSEGYLASGGRASLSDYYTAGYGAAVFDKRLRQNVVFSDHSLATDSVFAEVELITCRNVLIYFDRSLQERAFELFRDSLTRRGFLGLGARETLMFSSVVGDFTPFAPNERIYQKR